MLFAQMTGSVGATLVIDAYSMPRFALPCIAEAMTVMKLDSDSTTCEDLFGTRTESVDVQNSDSAATASYEDERLLRKNSLQLRDENLFGQHNVMWRSKYLFQRLKSCGVTYLRKVCVWLGVLSQKVASRDGCLLLTIKFSTNGVGKQGYGNRPPIDDRNPIWKFSIDCLDASKTNE